MGWFVRGAKTRGTTIAEAMQFQDKRMRKVERIRKRQKWNDGTDVRYNRPRACVQSSDAHAPEEIGRRPVFMRMETVSLLGIRAALANFREQVLFPADVAGA